MAKRWSHYCCREEKPHLVHVSASGKTIWLTDPLLSAARAEAKARGLTLKAFVVASLKDLLQ